ncbi:MAG: RNA polymerase sigma factor [Pseudomonadota bacterium]
MQVVRRTLDDRDADGALLAEVARGDRRAFRRLHERFHARLYGFALRTGLGADQADEATNDTLLAVWRSAATFEGRSTVATWIFGIAYRQAMRRHRRTRLDRALLPLEDAPATAWADNVAVLRVEQGADLAGAMARLDPEQRALVEMTYVWGFSVQEAADVVGCPPGTIKSRMARARHVLRRALEGGER